MKLFIQSMLFSFFTLLSITVLANINTASSVAGYWQNFSNPAETPVRLTEIPTGYSIVHVAFGEMAADGKVNFNLQGPPYVSMPDGNVIFKNDIKTLQAKGVKVLLSLGGQNAYFQVNSTAQKNNFVTTLSNLILDYGFDGIDYDFESGLSTANISYLVDATKELKQTFSAKGKSLFFTIAPETIDVYWQIFPNGKYDLLIQSGLINSVQVQLYNSGCMPGSKPGSICYAQGSKDFIVSQADSTIQTWMKQGIKNAESLYIIGLPASSSAAGGGYIDPAIIKKALICLQTFTECDTYVPTQAYPRLNNVMTWSINWDAKNHYAFVKSITGSAQNK